MPEEITNDHLKKLFSQKLALLRKVSKQTMEATADSLDMDVSEYYMLLSGKRLPHIKTLFRINEKYGVTMDWWFKEIREKAKTKTDTHAEAIQSELLGNLHKLDKRDKETLLNISRVLVKKT